MGIHPGETLHVADTRASLPLAVSALRARGVTLRYGDVLALDGADADFPIGSMTAIIGPNGAGKSTFLKSMLGLLDAEGEVLVGRSPARCPASPMCRSARRWIGRFRCG